MTHPVSELSFYHNEYLKIINYSPNCLYHFTISVKEMAYMTSRYGRPEKCSS